MTRNRPEPEAIVYCRTDRDITTVKSELEACFNEAAARLDTASISSEEGLNELIEGLRRNGRVTFGDQTHGIAVDVNGSSTNFTEVVETLQDKSIDHLIVPATPSPEIEALIECAIEERTVCHTVPGPWSNATVGMSDLMIRRAGPGESWTGRPPLGFEVESGHLVPNDEFESVVATLRLVQRGKLSKRSAADELNTSRRTITRCLESPDRYLLND